MRLLRKVTAAIPKRWLQNSALEFYAFDLRRGTSLATAPLPPPADIHLTALRVTMKHYVVLEDWNGDGAARLP